MNLKIIVFLKKVSKNFAIFLFLVKFLPLPINEKAYNEFLAFEEGSIEYLFRRKK